MKLASSEPTDDEAEKDLELLLLLLDEQVDGRPYGVRGRINVREALLRRLLSAGTVGKANAAKLLSRERDFFTPLRQRYLALEKQSVRPLWRYTMGRVLQVPPGLDCQTVKRWVGEGITEAQMQELERLLAINDQRREDERKRREPVVEQQAKVHHIELPRKPTQAEIEEDEILWQAAKDNAYDGNQERAPNVPSDAAAPKAADPSPEPPDSPPA